VYALVDLMELVGVVGIHHPALHAERTVNDPAIQRQQLIHRQRVACRFEPVQIREQEPSGIADAPIGVRGPFQDSLRDRHLSGEIGCGHPQTQNVRTEGRYDLLRRDDVAA